MHCQQLLPNGTGKGKHLCRNSATQGIYCKIHNRPHFRGKFHPELPPTFLRKEHTMPKSNTWRTVRVLVEIPLLAPDLTDKAVVQAFAESFDHSLPKLDCPQLGTIRIKNAQLVFSALARKNAKKAW